MDRRDFIKRGSLVVSASISSQSANVFAKSDKRGQNTLEDSGLRWLEGEAPKVNAGVTWGQAWKQGSLNKEQSLKLVTAKGESIALQSWPTAYWPDGSVKWTAHATPSALGLEPGFKVEIGKPLGLKQKARVKSKKKCFEVDTGSAQFEVPKSGAYLVSKMSRNKQVIGENAHLVALTQSTVDIEDAPFQIRTYQSNIKAVVVEQDGPVRITIRVEGVHTDDSGHSWLPFTLRLYFYAGSESIKITHSFIYDGDDQKDFIRGLGLRFNVVQRDETYDRHIRFAGEGDGLWAEAVKGITGLRRDPGKAIKDAQIAGEKTPPLSEWSTRVTDRLHWIPEWNDFSLTQISANGFSIKKRTKRNHAWVDADQGTRAHGVAYLGGTSGGVLFGMRDFWQQHPVQIDIRNAAQEKSEATLWFWSPEAEPMDVRFYHDGLGQETYEDQLDALNITYEDYESGFGTAHGVARTTEFTLCVCGGTPSRQKIVDWADFISHPNQVVDAPQNYLEAGVFGSLWSLPDTSTDAKRNIEERLRWQIQYYKKQVDQRHWYGFWNYGDVMHTYDVDRHVWRYDIGGYAWDNSELSPDLWLWYSFLRTGDADAFRLAEAMTRHTRDVDMYHLGRFKGLGTRHNVQHWGCSAKQLRISTAIYRRFHYFLTADERTGDVLTEVSDSVEALAAVDATRKISSRLPTPGDARIGLGTDWSAVAANWLTAWERSGKPEYKTKLIDAMTAIGMHPQGFFAGAFGIDTHSGQLIPTEDQGPSISHLSAVFGLQEVNAELIQLLNIPEYEQAWLKYCRLYNASADEQRAELGKSFRSNLRAPHSRLTAYAASKEQNEALGSRAWEEFRARQEFAKQWDGKPWAIQSVSGPDVLNDIEEAPWLSTNDAGQWGLAAIQNLALASFALKDE